MTDHSTLKLIKINLQHSIDYLENTLGQPWLEENLKRLKNAQGGLVNFGCGINTDTANAIVPRLAYWWYKAQEEISMARISGQKYPGYFSLITASVGNDLLTLQRCPNLDKKIAAIKEFDCSAKVTSELSIAAGYVRAGADVYFNEDGFSIYNNHTFVESMVIAIEPDQLSFPDATTEKDYLPHLIYLHPGVHHLDFKYDCPKQWLIIEKAVTELASNNGYNIIGCCTSLQNYNGRHQLLQNNRLYQGTQQAAFNLYLPNNIIMLGA